MLMAGFCSSTSFSALAHTISQLLSPASCEALAWHAKGAASVAGWESLRSKRTLPPQMMSRRRPTFRLPLKSTPSVQLLYLSSFSLPGKNADLRGERGRRPGLICTRSLSGCAEKEENANRVSFKERERERAKKKNELDVGNSFASLSRIIRLEFVFTIASPSNDMRGSTRPA